MTVEEFLSRVTSRELTEWIAYNELEPIPTTPLADRRAALVARTIAEVNRNEKKRSQPYEISDFMPRYGERAREQSPELQKSILGSIVSTFGGKVNGQWVKPGGAK